MSSDAVRAHRERLQRFAALPDIANLGALVAEAARLYPQRAIIDFFEDGESLTAAALHELSDRFANGLAAIGLRKGDHVGVMLPNRLEYPVTYLAIAKLGAVMVPINPRYTARELHYVLTDAQVGALVIDAEHLPLFDSLVDRPAALENPRVVVRGAAALEGSRSWEALCAGGAPSFAPSVPVTKDDLLTILYTSGTTGFPKGCLLPQDYWLMLARATCAWTELPVTRMLLQNPFHYMNCQFVLPTALMLGATLHVAARPSASKFIPWIKQLGIEWCVFPEIVLKQPEAADDARTQLKLALLAAVSPGGQVEIERRFKVPARELYGMSEIGAGLAMPVHVTDMPGSNSVGIEMLLRRATIRGEDGAPVKPGEPGELWMAGRGIMKGYFNKPEANADAFR
ncbi:MAG: acyl--CoA ligase, partial [Alphaproteobacteria bacterium]|nr:acyl--CoA ligase [Alphaproteobacteria bacterium]